MSERGYDTAHEEANSFRGVVGLFPQERGWHFVRVPPELGDPLQSHADRCLVAVSAALGRQTWDTSLLPMGDGTVFIALPAKVRNREGINAGDTMAVTFSLRERR
ncbi:MAG: DUF1905 domain-containing protein [Deltaproteobacteria bacterium]|jgi:hypothetical protein|nr:DUF1905 domain-containing protein [Deltaproteobacteria bacterium]